jgi:F-type H+-transporting ATPase subunit b
MRALILALGLVLCASAVAVGQPHGDQPAAPEVPENLGITTEGGEGHGASEHHGAHEDPTRWFNWYRMHYGKDLKGGPMGDGKLGDEPLPAGEKEEPMSAPFALMVLNFVVLLLILGKFGGPVARKIAESRSDQIKTALDEAAKLRDQARAKLDEYSKKLEASDAEIKSMIEGIRLTAEEDRKRVIAAAETQAHALKKEAEERIAAEIDLARHALAREVATAAAAVAEKMIRDKASSSDQTKLVESFISDLGGTAAAPRERT